MASRPAERRCFIDYLPSLLLLWGLLFFQQDISAQQQDGVDLVLEMDGGCLTTYSVGSNNYTEFSITVRNIGNEDLDRHGFWGVWWPTITVEVKINGILLSTESVQETLDKRTGRRDFVFRESGLISGNMTATVSATYYKILSSEDGEPVNKENNSSTATVLSRPLPGSLGGDQTVCWNSNPTLGVEGEDLFAQGATASFKWEWAPANSENWKEIKGVTEGTYTPSPVLDTIRFRRTAIATIGQGSANMLVCESDPEVTEIVVAPKICQVATNPMIRTQRSRTGKQGINSHATSDVD